MVRAVGYGEQDVKVFIVTLDDKFRGSSKMMFFYLFIIANCHEMCNICSM